jgi:hypothetical protein
MRTLALALAVLLTACGPFHLGSSGGASVVFTNQTTDQADVYASTVATDPVRIGTVLAGQTSTISVPATVVGRAGQLSIVAHLVAGGTVSTGPFSLGVGQTADLRLPADARSIVIVGIR